MSSHVGQAEIALYVSGDLEEQESRRIKGHVRACPACESLLREFEACTALFGNFCSEPAQDDLIEIRQKVMARIQSRKRMDWRWKWCAGLATAAVTVIVALGRHHPAPVTEPSITNIAQRISLPLEPVSPQPLQIERASIRRKMRYAPKPHLRSVVLVGRVDEPLIEMNTSDPDVVILLQTHEMKPSERTRGE